MVLLSSYENQHATVSYEDQNKTLLKEFKTPPSRSDPRLFQPFKIYRLFLLPIELYHISDIQTYWKYGRIQICLYSF